MYLVLLYLVFLINYLNTYWAYFSSRILDELYLLLIMNKNKRLQSSLKIGLKHISKNFDLVSQFLS